MSIDLQPLVGCPRLLFNIPLRPLQGHRFQPTGFPKLGAATYQTQEGLCLLVESSQSMANRMEAVCWDDTRHTLTAGLNGLSHVTVTRKGAFFTDTVLEAHRLNSPYVIKSDKMKFSERLKLELGLPEPKHIDQSRLAATLFKYDVGSLLHGAFLEKLSGRVRATRALSAFIEADGVTLAPSGGVKNDLNPQGDTKAGFGNVLFARDEYTGRITLYINLDLALLRGYGLGADCEEMLILLSLYKIANLLEKGLRLRTACDLEPAVAVIESTRPSGFKLPQVVDLAASLAVSIDKCRDSMIHTTVAFEEAIEESKDQDSEGDEAGEEE